MIKVDKEGRNKLNKLLHEVLLTKGINSFNTVAEIVADIKPIEENIKSKVSDLDQVEVMNADDKEA